MSEQLDQVIQDEGGELSPRFYVIRPEGDETFFARTLARLFNAPGLTIPTEIKYDGRSDQKLTETEMFEIAISIATNNHQDTMPLHDDEVCMKYTEVMQHLRAGAMIVSITNNDDNLRAINAFDFFYPQD